MNQVATQPSNSPPQANSAEPPPHPGFDAPTSVRAHVPAHRVFEQEHRSQSTMVEQTRAIAEVQGQIDLAKRYPRDETRAIEKMREACRRYSLAENAFYSFPRAGETISGASINLACELARIWGNFAHGPVELFRNDPKGESEYLVFAWDLETNVQSKNTFVIPHARDTKKGVKNLIDLRDIYENNANNASRRLRECIFKVLPKWFTDEAQQICRETLEKGRDDKPLVQRIADMIAAFEALNVSRAMIEKRIQKSLDKMTAMDVAQLGIVFRSLKNGEISRDEAFPETPAADVDKALREKTTKSDPGPVSREPEPNATSTASQSSATTPANEAQGQDGAEHSDDAIFITAAKDIIGKIEKSGSLKAMENLINAVEANKIAALPEQYRAQVAAAEAKRRAQFAK